MRSFQKYVRYFKVRVRIPSSFASSAETRSTDTVQASDMRIHMKWGRPHTIEREQRQRDTKRINHST
jgi:predicted PP-loop superfamily ATPase